METTEHETVLEGSQAQGVGRRRSRDAPRGGGTRLRDLRALDQALAKEAKGNRERGALSHPRSPGHEGRAACRVATNPARKRSRPDARGALRGVRGGLGGEG